MELWVRSQSKLGLYVADEIYIDERDFGNDDIQYYVMFGQVRLGVYKSKERALEILDEIQKKINLINLGHDFGSPMIDLDNPTYIYQMPSE